MRAGHHQECATSVNRDCRPEEPGMVPRPAASRTWCGSERNREREQREGQGWMLAACGVLLSIPSSSSLHPTGWSPTWAWMGGPEGRRLPDAPHMTSQRAFGGSFATLQPPSLWLIPNYTRPGALGGDQPSE